MNPFARFKAWLEWRRRDKLGSAVATAKFTTRYVDGDVDTGRTEVHVVTFFRDGNGLRYSRVDTSCEWASERHGPLVEARTLWRVHGHLPTFAVMALRASDRKPFQVIDGGAA